MSVCEDKLRTLVRKVCHTPLLVAGQFVPVDETQLSPHHRKTIATVHELLNALEHMVLTLHTANAYLRTQVPEVSNEKSDDR